ncbi:MAG TPA: aldehyde dehydrogenase family protein, partial [Gemmata sp.]|nr:aldehyde dehydrogenase family protein [Gemmata sp.]
MSAVPVKNRQLYIGGQWCDSASGKKLAVENPATEETIAEVSSGGREECRKAIAAASEAMKSW